MELPPLSRDIRYQAAIIQDDQVLLAEMRASDGRTFWIAPGGGREGDETAEETVRREVLEETSLEVRVIRLLFTEPDIPGGVYQSLHTWLCIPLSGKVQVGIEPEFETYGALIPLIERLAWFDLRDPGSWEAVAPLEERTRLWLERVRRIVIVDQDPEAKAR